MGLLEGRVALVTGAGRGIGRAYALGLGDQGAAVVVNDVGTSLRGLPTAEDPADELAAAIAAGGGRAVASRHSVADFSGAAAAVGTALDAFGRLDIVVNNAGITRNGPLLSMSEEDFDAVVGVHLKGTFNVTRHAAPHMRDQHYGRIVNITSGAGLKGAPGFTNYAAAKAGVVGMTMVWALELAGHGITVNAFNPMGETRMTERLYERQGRRGRPVLDPAHNVALVAFLASERAGHVNGQVFGRDGFGYSIYSGTGPVAALTTPGGWTPETLAARFDAVLGPHLQPVGLRGVRFDRAGP